MGHLFGLYVLPKLLRMAVVLLMVVVTVVVDLVVLVAKNSIMPGAG